MLYCVLNDILIVLYWTVIVQGTTSSDTFKGILIIAKDQSGQQILGYWSSGSLLQTIDCNGVSATGITHTSSATKTQIQAIWHTPSTISQGSTIIRATIVKSFSIFYQDCFSVTLTSSQVTQIVGFVVCKNRFLVHFGYYLVKFYHYDHEYKEQFYNYNY